MEEDETNNKIDLLNNREQEQEAVPENKTRIGKEIPKEEDDLVEEKLSTTEGVKLKPPSLSGKSEDENGKTLKKINSQTRKFCNNKINETLKQWHYSSLRKKIKDSLLHNKNGLNKVADDINTATNETTKTDQSDRSSILTKCVDNLKETFCNEKTDVATSTDLGDEVELRRKPFTFALRESFRNSFRLKRSNSEPPKRDRGVEVSPRRWETFQDVPRTELVRPRLKIQPRGDLLFAENPPADGEDVSDLEDLKHVADPALLNESSGNFGSAGARSAPSTPQGLLCTPPCGLAEPPFSLGCTSPSIQRSPSHSVFTKCEKASLKHLSTSTPVMTAQAQLSEPPSPKAVKDPKVHTTSKARQKKFLRHFPNVEDDEKVLNHYSCALIGDILLQGHLYITKNYFAFYSNVFGYVTKLLIPILTVENITKEKTARIIPNAVGISTSEDKHVFGSLMSRDNTLQYMRTVWQKAKSASPIIIEPEIIEHDLDSSESGESGRDSPPIEIKPRFSLVKKLEKETLIKQTEGLLYETKGSNGLVITMKGAISEFRRLPRQSLILFATTLLLILLFLSAAVLLYRISKIQNKYSLALQDHTMVSGSEDIYGDLLQWQTQLHSKSAGAVHSFLESNLDQIAKVRQSLEALSSLLVQNSAHEKPLEANKDSS